MTGQSLNPITALTELAMSNYQFAVQGNQAMSQLTLATMATGDPFRDGILRFNFLGPEMDLEQPSAAVSSEPSLEFLRSARNDLGFMIVHQGGAGRTSLHGIVGSLLTSAAMRMHLLHLQPSESSFVGLVLENYEELKRAARGEEVRGYRIIGFSGLKLREEDRVATPWGTLYPAPDFAPSLAWRPNTPITTAILAAPQLFPVVISDEPNPHPLPQDQEALRQVERVGQLLPLAFALATKESNVCAPLITFQSVIYPFGTGFGWSSSGPGIFPLVAPAEPTPEELVQAEVWSRRLDQHYVENLQIAGRRIISAIAQRTDQTDALIDAVTAWESMVGTGTETSFRLTAALSKLLEPDPRKRIAFRKDLGSIYTLRSRVVHGDPVEAPAVASAASRAIDIGLKTLSALYAKSEDWLTAKSEERANRLILED